MIIDYFYIVETVFLICKAFYHVLIIHVLRVHVNQFLFRMVGILFSLGTNQCVNFLLFYA